MTLPLMFQPSPAFVLLRGGAWLAGAATLLIVAISAGWPGWIMGVGAVVMLGVLVWNGLVRAAERYTLTDEGATWESGVIRRVRVDVPLARVQNTVLYRSVGERVLGVGTIGIATAGTDGYEIVWRSVRGPERVLAAVREACARATGNNRPVPEASETSRSSAAGAACPVIGLAGGIGSGKSTVARMLGELGCLVIDSDQRVRAALDRPEVRATLVSWWGPGVLTAQGRVDRARVSDIVFKDAAERQRLEDLVHPIVRQDRAAMVAEAAGGGSGVRAVVVDAPLLFEAGLDKECDAVIFVEAPEADRLARVQRTRGWDAAELQRREAAQWPLEEKRRRSTRVVQNVGDEAALAGAVRAILDELAPGGRGRSGGR